MKERKLILPVLIGPPGVGKTTIAEMINRLSHGVSVLDGDSFISEAGILRLQNNTWDDTDRVTYLARMAEGVSRQLSEQNKIMLIDAMTTKWMRHFFANKISQSPEIDLRWVEVRREFQQQEIEDLVRERYQAGHPINSIEVFERFSRQFEPLDPPFETLINPGIKVPKQVLENRVLRLVGDLYEGME